MTITLGSITPYTVYADDDDDDKNTKFKKHKVHTGDGPPPNGLGKVGDLYIDSSDTDNLVIHKKTSKNTWTNLGPFQGSEGEKGDKGDPGDIGPAGQDGINCWDLDGDGTKSLPDEDANGDGTVDVLDCKGPKGDKGDKGDTGETGPRGETGSAGIANFVFAQQQGNTAELNEISFGEAVPVLTQSQGTAISWDRTRDVFIVNESGVYEVDVSLTVNDFSDPSTFDQVRLQLFVGGFSTGLSQGYVGLFEQMSYHWIGQLISGTEISAKIVTLNPEDEMGIANQSTMSVKKLS